jgi:hypothetical protein
MGAGNTKYSTYKVTHLKMDSILTCKLHSFSGWLTLLHPEICTSASWFLMTGQ